MKGYKRYLKNLDRKQKIYTVMMLLHSQQRYHISMKRSHQTTNGE